MSDLSIGNLRRKHRFMRSVASLVLLVHTTVLLAPGALAAEATVREAHHAPAQPPARTPANGRAEIDPHTNVLRSIEQQLLSIEAKHRSKGARLEDLGAERASLRDLHDTLRRQDAIDQADFDAVAAHLREHHLPAAIVQRHQLAVAQFKAASLATHADLDALDNARDVEILQQVTERLHAHIHQFPGQHHHQPVDPKNLPFRMPAKKPVAPRVTREQFAQWMPDDSRRPMRVAGLDLLPLTTAGALLPNDPAYLAPSQDVQITQAVKDLATQLQHNPVAIYNWVHDHIEYLPTYGSVQGSDLTLQAKRGNAYDTASLLIALLRASGTPARYVYGTVEMPIEKVRNWVGGIQDPQAALDLLGQGGVPVTGLAQGGRIVSARMEHVWVEAYVDFAPSRGTRNLAPNTWVPLDASFKQYTYAPGVNFPTAVPNGANLYADLLSGAAVDSSQGSIANVDVTSLQADYDDYQSAVTQYVTSLGSGATPASLLGARTIQPSTLPALAASLPYHVDVVASRAPALIPALEHTVELTLYASQTDQDNDSPALTQTIALADLGSKRLGITYRAATPNDQAVIDSYAQAGANNLPAYLINVVPVIQIDGADVAVGPPVGMGQDQFWAVTVGGPGNVGSNPHTYDRIAGDEMVLEIDRNGVTQDIIASRQNNPAPGAAAEGLHQIGLLYWSETDLANGFAASTGGFVRQRLPSAGLFSSPMTVQYSYGVPRFGFYQSVEVDIASAVLAAVGVNGGPTNSFNFAAGTQASLLEGRVLDQATGAAQGTASSAAQLLSDAAAQGIPLYTITAANAATVLPQLNVDPDIYNDISTALGVGKTVIVSQTAPDSLDWSGTGYVILDPDTGSGAYLIKGALNGGEIPECEKERQPVTVAIQETLQTLMWLALLAAAVATAITITTSTGGAGAPAGAQLLVVAVAIAAIIWPPNASAAGKCSGDCHRGRVQAQGNNLEKSVNWAQGTPVTLTQGLQFLAMLKAQLTPQQVAERADGFAQAEAFMRRAAASGGVCAQDIRSSLSFPGRGPIRVDIEVRQGKAFVPP